jgi:hypothetical protein
MTARRALVPLVVVGVLSLIGEARAQPAEEGSPAEIAFREGRTAMAAGDLGKACARFADSQRLGPAAGTQLNLAECLDKRGLTASAASTYEDAAKSAAQRGRADWEKLARERSEVLKKLAPRVTFRVATTELDGLSLLGDGTAVQPNATILINPGTHKVEAAARGRKPWTTTFDVKNGDALKIDVPRLLSDRGVASPPEQPPAPAASGGGLRTLGLVLGGVGIAGIATGAVTGLLAFSAHDDAMMKCAHYPDRCPTDGTGTSANERARTMATISTIGFIAGGALLAGGTILFFAAPPRGTSGLRVSPSIGLAGSAAIAVDGAF